ncbi:hypothetical protein BGX23_006640 [Mortierella sp. AD031]|nr:hypothetical protein BGX23_006640 [Mortierella sp. AD031]
MPRCSTLIAILVLALVSMCISSAAPSLVRRAEPYMLTIEELRIITSSYCPVVTAGEAITCEDALPYINSAINKQISFLAVYNLDTKGKRSAYLASMLANSHILNYNHDIMADPPRGNTGGGYVVDILIRNHLDFEPGACDDFDSKAERATFLSTILFNTNYLAIMQPGTNLVSRRGSVFMLTEVQAQSYFKSNAWLLQASKSFQSPGKPMSAREVNGGGHGIFGSACCGSSCRGLEVTGAFRQWANGCIGATDQTIGERTQLFNRVYEALP